MYVNSKMLIILKVCSKTTVNIFNKNYFHTTTTNNGVSRAMKKVMGLNSKANRKHRYIEDALLPSTNEFSRGSFEGKKPTNSKRSSVLNKLFMRHITDLMATGESASEFLGHGIEINRVKVTPDFSNVLVYWIAKGNKYDERIDEILETNAFALRHELSQLKIMGEVPRIKFVKDKQYANLMELDSLLSIADYGEDHVPVEPSLKLKTQLELHTPLDDNLKRKIQNLENETDTTDLLLEETFPEMPQNVLGLDHASILNRVKRTIKKSQTLHRLKEEDNNNTERLTKDETNNEYVSAASIRDERQEFKDFLHARQLLRSKLKKINKNYTPDMQYIKEELEERSRNYFDNMDVFDDNINEDEDYVSEDECENK